ncbi:MAG: TonB-dependent receptor [Bacteroidota bacterium]|nr:TonB-dependent receptor [Bacteroidota bacterium]
MKYLFSSILALSFCFLCYPKVFAQGAIVTGKISSAETKEAIPAASVLLKGSSSGTFTDSKGIFRLNVPNAFPVTLEISSVGYESKEVAVAGNAEVLNIELLPASEIGTEVVVSATRSRIRSLESPVSIERMSTSAIREAPAPSFYDAIANLKGVDVVTSSILFKTPGTRGFNGSGNLRMNQLVDGMDNQAPGLNFSVGNIVGLNELDVDNVELLPGASSALYGSGGMTGTILMTSKDPFKYQGLSVQIKQGVNHIGDENSKAAPYYDWMARYAKAFNNKFAFRVSAEYTQAKDWMVSDYRNFSALKGQPVPGDRSQPDYNGINGYGDESAYFNVQDQLKKAAAAYLAAGDPVTAAQLNGIASLTPANSGVSRTGYNENALTDYKAYNFKASAGLFYKITGNTTASLSGNFGSANTVYQGTDRYSLRNVRIGQYKAEVAGKRFYVRAYTTQENAGNSYDMVAAATLLNESYAPTATVWAPNYINAYAQTFGAAYGGGQTPAQAYVTASAAARAYADANRLMPGTTAFNKSLDSLKQLAIPSGGKFNDQTNLYVGEGMYNFSDFIKWADITVGASTREFVLNSHGTIFADTAGTIKINESGAFAQIQKGFFNDLLKMTLAGRYDKNSNFAGRFTPRVTAVFRLAPDHFIRASFQTAYRFPSTQNQYINLQTGSARLIGGLPQFIDAYGLRSDTYDTASLGNYQRTGTAPTQYQFKEFKPETVASWELGYKGLIAKKLLIDIYGFYAQYTNFIGLTVLIKDPFTLGQTNRNTFGIYTNSGNKVNTVGAGLGLEYALPMGFTASGNLAYNDISNKDITVLTQFNTPKIKFNLSVANYTIAKYYGFNLTYRWQESYLYESSFVSGTTPAFGTLDGQISMKLPKVHGTIKLGATNLLNKYYVDAIGNASIGGLYYISLGYNL